MPVNIHGKQYITVAERVQALHEDINGRAVSITTEFIPNGEAIVCKATVKIGDSIFQGTSAANPNKAIEKQSPYEVAETSAVGRALGFAGYGIVEGIASADEMMVAETKNESPKAPVSTQTNSTPVSKPAKYCTVHGEEMPFGISKSGKEYWAHKNAKGEYCFGTEYLPKKA